MVSSWWSSEDRSSLGPSQGPQTRAEQLPVRAQAVDAQMVEWAHAVIGQKSDDMR